MTHQAQILINVSFSTFSHNIPHRDFSVDCYDSLRSLVRLDFWQGLMKLKAIL